jgi:hypothetical protein
MSGSAAAAENLLKNPGFEETAPNSDPLPGWAATADSEAKSTVVSTEAREGRRCLAIPANSSVEQQSGTIRAGAYIARCWVKSEKAQRVTLILRDAARPWAAYNYAEISVPKGQWAPVEIECPLDRDGRLTLALGGMSQEFRAYHGAGEAMRSPILADDFELVRSEPKTTPRLEFWDAGKDLTAAPDWSAKDQWAAVREQSHVFAGTPVFQSRHLAGITRNEDGALLIYAIGEGGLKQRGVIAPSPAFKVSESSLVHEGGRVGLRVAAGSGGQSYTAWITPEGLIRIQAEKTPQFILRDCPMRYGILPSFVGADLCYAPAKIAANRASLPSTQWFVGLVEGHDSMLVAAWDSDAQAVSMGLAGEGSKRVIDSLAIATEKGGFALSYVEHANLWHEERLQEDWLGEYTPIEWKRPFEAGWTGQFFISPGARYSFHEPYNDYSFPIANMKTRMWGVWFEDWNRYPFYFDGEKTVLHFEKSFTPKGNALIYFLQPAAADLYSPCEIVEQAFGPEKAAALFDFDANKVRKLKYSTPDEFMYDRPVCATTTHLSQIKGAEKATVGVNLATHLYEFIRGIRGRVDQYGEFFTQTQSDLAREKAAHPEMAMYIAGLEKLVADAQAKAGEVYATPLPAVQAKTESMKKLLLEGKADGFDCGSLDVRGPAGEQDDLCRRYNRVVMRLVQTAAFTALGSPEEAALAKHLWDRSRQILREPTRWESRRTLYFFEP